MTRPSLAIPHSTLRLLQLADSAFPVGAYAFSDGLETLTARGEVAVEDLAVGDLAVVVGVSAGHRQEAFAAARRLIDEVKAEVPVWKHQTFESGEAAWVGAC